LDSRMPEETVPGQMATLQGESLRIEAEPWERAGAVRHPREYAPGEADARGLGDREAALLPIDRAFSDLPPFTVADLRSADPDKRASAVFEVARSGVKDGF